MPTTTILEGYKDLSWVLHTLIGQNTPSKSPICPHTPQSNLLVDCLPIEILQSMFEFFVADGGHLEVLSLVSKRWRDAAVSYSKLWSYIHISRDAWRRRFSETSLAKRVRKAVIESEGNNLHVTVDTRTWGDLPQRPFNLALEECGGEESAEMWRWETLKLDLGAWVPTKFLRYFTPQLRELTYRTTRIHDLSICFPYTAALSTLRLNGDYSTTWPASAAQFGLSIWNSMKAARCGTRSNSSPISAHYP